MVEDAADSERESQPDGEVSLESLAPDAPPERSEGGSVEPECASPKQAFEAHFDMVWRSLRRLGVPQSNLDDAVQDVFLVIHRRWDDFQRQSTLRTWIYGVTLRVASDHTRRARRDRARYAAELPDVMSPVDAPDRLYQQREAGRLLHASLGELDEPERQIMVLVDLEERSVVEASESLGINLNTAYSRLRRARQRFEKALRSQTRSTGALRVHRAKRDDRG